MIESAQNPCLTAADLLSEIAKSADYADRLAGIANYEDLQEMELQLEALRASVCRMGWLAELCHGQLCRAGASPTSWRGRTAEAWLLPQACKLPQEIRHA